MEEFAKMIFEQWLKEQNYDVDFFTEKTREYLCDAEKFLNITVINHLYDVLCDNGEEIMRDAFIAGFGYACKCLSNGKIELGGGFNE